MKSSESNIYSSRKLCPKLVKIVRGRDIKVSWVKKLVAGIWRRVGAIWLTYEPSIYVRPHLPHPLWNITWTPYLILSYLILEGWKEFCNQKVGQALWIYSFSPQISKDLKKHSIDQAYLGPIKILVYKMYILYTSYIIQPYPCLMEHLLKFDWMKNIWQAKWRETNIFLLAYISKFGWDMFIFFFYQK